MPSAEKMNTLINRGRSIVALALATICLSPLQANEEAFKFAPASSLTGATILSITWPTTLRIACDKGFIEINYATGAVTIPEGTKMPAAARAFWEETVRAFPEFKKAVIKGDKTAHAKSAKMRTSP